MSKQKQPRNRALLALKKREKRKGFRCPEHVQNLAEVGNKVM